MINSPSKVSERIAEGFCRKFFTSVPQVTSVRITIIIIINMILLSSVSASSIGFGDSMQKGYKKEGSFSEQAYPLVSTHLSPDVLSEVNQGRNVHKAEKCEKNKKYGQATFHAIDALISTKKVKEKHTKAALQILHRTYPKAIASFVATIETLENESQIFSGMQTVQQRQSIVSLLKERMRLQDQIRKLPDKFLIPQKIPSDDEEMLKKHLAQATMLLDEAKTFQAENDYQSALAILDSKKSLTLKEGRLAYLALNNCLRLIPGYKDAAILRGKARDLATVYIIPKVTIKNNISANGDVISGIIQGFEREFNHQMKGNRFVKLMKSDFQATHKLRIQIVITAIDYHFSNEKGESQKIEKTVTVDEQEKTVRATVTTYEKIARAGIKAEFSLSDLSTGKILKRDYDMAVGDWLHKYAIYSGSFEAIKGTGWTTLIGQGKLKIDYPPKSEIEQKAAYILGGYVFRHISGLAKSYSL